MEPLTKTGKELLKKQTKIHETFSAFLAEMQTDFNNNIPFTVEKKDRLRFLIQMCTALDNEIAKESTKNYLKLREGFFEQD